MANRARSHLLDYLAARGPNPGERLPSIPELAQTLGISTGKLREQLEVARALGLVEVRPKTGIRTRPYAFYPAVSLSLRFALAQDPGAFEAFGVLRNHIEASFWHEAVRRLTAEDKEHLEALVAQAWSKLRGRPIHIPHVEHRDLHLTIFSRLENPFVQGLLEAYWDAYEAVGLNLYADYAYLERVWTYHERMVRAILEGDLEAGYQALVEHTGLLQRRPEMDSHPPKGRTVVPIAESR